MSATCCRICGCPNEKDLFSAVTQEPVCSICKIKFVGGLPTTKERIEQVRSRLGLKETEFLEQDRGKEAKRILGHLNNG